VELSNAPNSRTAERTNMRSGGCDLATVGEEAERPGRLTPKQIRAIVDLWRTGLGIGEIEKLTGAGRATIHHYTKNIPRSGNDEPNWGAVPTPPQVIDLRQGAGQLRQTPDVVPAKIQLGMGIVVDFELIAILKGFSSQEGFLDFNEYVRKRVVRWMGALKDFCPNEGPQEFFEKMTKVVHEVNEARRIEKQRDRWPAGRAYLIKNMELLGWAPEQIQREIALIDEIARRERFS